MTYSLRIASPALATALVFGLLAGPSLAQTTPQSAPQATPPTGSLSLAPSSGAAATLPNTFDGPPRSTAPSGPAPVPEPSAPRVSEVQLAAAALESVINQFKTGDIDETLFTPEVASRLNSQLSTYRGVIDGYGPLQSIEPQGVFNGLGQFLVIFDNAATQWQIGLNDEGRIAALRFREAPPESSDPPAGN